MVYLLLLTCPFGLVVVDSRMFSLVVFVDSRMFGLVVVVDSRMFGLVVVVDSRMLVGNMCNLSLRATIRNCKTK